LTTEKGYISDELPTGVFLYLMKFERVKCRESFINKKIW
jgi:hypothetical protein